MGGRMITYGTAEWQRYAPPVSRPGPGDRVQIDTVLGTVACTAVHLALPCGSGVEHAPGEAVVILDFGDRIAFPLRELLGIDSGADLIAAERRRQVVVEGYPTSHDLSHEQDGELAIAAWCYLGDVVNVEQDGNATEEPAEWPWPHVGEGNVNVPGCSWKPTPNDRVRQLVKAGALIAAEIDRLRALEAIDR